MVIEVSPLAERRYLFVINSLLPGGAERSLVELLPRLVDRGVTPILVCLYRPEISLEAEVVAGGFDLRLLDELNHLGRLRAIRKIIKSERPNLVHTTLFEADVIGRLAAIGTGVPVMSTLANATYDRARIKVDSNLRPSKVAVVRFIDGFTARHFTAHFHAVSAAVKASSITALHVDDSEVTVVYRGRDSQRLGRRTPERRASTRAKLGLAPDDEMVLTVGRQEFQKGHNHLIRAYIELADQRPRAHLFVAGRAGNATEDLERIVAGSAVADRIHFLGHRGDAADLIAAADVFVFPSLWEGLGGALIEALALEVPIVASDIPALREVVVSGEHGMLVPPSDPGSIREAIERLLDDSGEAMRLTENNRYRFEELFGIEKNSSSLIDLMASVAS